jgi:hypothetical protein
MNYYIFNIASKDKSSFTHTIIFDYSNDSSYKNLKDELREFYTFNYKTEFICILTKKTNSTLALLLKSLNDIKGVEILILYYDADGFINYDSAEGKAPSIGEIQSQGLYRIFESNKGILESDISYHYVLPSGKHSPYFIRVGNILNNHSEVYFISFWLLKHIKDDCFKIYYDTSSILAILITTLQLRQSLGNPKRFELISFSSYEKVDEFEFDSGSLIVVSASNSGNLQNKIRFKNPSLDLVTIIYNNNKNIDVQCLLNISHFVDLSNYKQFQGHEECEYCKLSSTPVNIAGEQFLPLKLATQKVTLFKECAPDWIRIFMNQFAYQDIIVCNKSENDKTREIYLDLTAHHEKIDLTCESEKKNLIDYNSEFIKFIENKIPASLEYIIYLDDPASKIIADQVYKFIKIKLPNLNAPIAHVNLESLKASTKCSALIVASSIASGNRLNYVSKELRRLEKLSLVYLIGVMRTSSEKNAKNLTSNLQVRDDKLSANHVQSLTKICIPDNHSKYNNELFRSPWQIEKIQLENLLKGGLENDFLLNRIVVLSQNGIRNKLFWYNPIDKKELKLNKNFAFFRFEDLCQGDFIQPNQSEVYFIISSILHHLRTFHTSLNKPLVVNGKKIIPLVQHEHMKSFLSPDNFIRFNDGIIQACILRAATPAELNYSIDIALSHEMKQTLMSLFSNLKSPSSEAILEFLYAFWRKRLRLLDKDLEEFLDHIQKNFSSSEEIVFFIDLIRNSNKIEKLEFN